MSRQRLKYVTKEKTRTRSVASSQTKTLLHDCSLDYGLMAITIKDGHPIYMRDGSSIFDRLELSGSECMGNFFNMMVRWHSRPGFDEFMRDIACYSKIRDISEYWSTEIMQTGLGIYEITGGQSRWNGGKYTYEDFMDSEAADGLNMKVRSQISKIKSLLAVDRRLESAMESTRDAFERYTSIPSVGNGYYYL